MFHYLRISHLEDEKSFLEEKNVNLIENERDLQDKLQKFQAKSVKFVRNIQFWFLLFFYVLFSVARFRTTKSTNC